MVASKQSTMSDRRALLTDREREIVAGEADVSDSYRYQTISRVRARFDRLEADLEALEAHGDLASELRGIVCTDERAETPVEGEAGASTAPAPNPRERTDTAGDDHGGGPGPEADHADRAVPSNIGAAVREWVADRPPKKNHAKDLVVDVVLELREDGPLSTGDLQARLFEKYGDHYSSDRTMWNAISRYLDDVPGLEKPEYGTWDYAGDDATRAALEADDETE